MARSIIMRKREQPEEPAGGSGVLARTLRELQEALEAAQGRVGWVAEELDGLALPATRPAAHLYRERRRRSDFFPDDLFAEPAWDLLLYFYDADATGARVPVKSAAYAAAVPPSTAIRWIKLLTKAGYLTPAGATNGDRRTYLEISEKGRRAMSGYLSGSRAERAPE